jgi:hypothetical protein
MWLEGGNETEPEFSVQVEKDISTRKASIFLHDSLTTDEYFTYPSHTIMTAKTS